MLYFRFVTNTFVLGVVGVKLWEEGRIVKRKQDVRGRQYLLRCIGEFDVKPRQNARGGKFVSPGHCSIRSKKVKKADALSICCELFLTPPPRRHGRMRVGSVFGRLMGAIHAVRVSAT